jgi:predicted nucleic acid-binding protein
LIAADTSSLIRFLEGAGSADADQVRAALRADRLWLPPPAKTELLSRPVVGATFDELILGARLLAFTPGYWERAGHSRRIILAQGLKARLADALIAQCCVDADMPLITSDSDFRHFERWCGLKMAA